MVQFSFLLLAFSATLLPTFASPNYIINYSYLDVMAQSYCAARVPGAEWVFALRRNCTMAPDCNTMCNNAKTSILSAISNQRTSTACFDAFNVIKDHPILSPNSGNDQPDSGQVNLGSYSYGTSGCTWPANKCGPNYCCCKAFSP
ncbi:hypothetical protein MAR_003529 [Mya arenaria]|uniref:Secreted protein n=1 Tax=Mya arenaria TaxID=6604 RepID=A0ABY7GA31_MYAAR|nr:uncharacterized protein LOC128222020 [Mya arenaria]WAR29961.1 hypothetical protein MAR_003529 [Mya arenaria]